MSKKEKLIKELLDLVGDDRFTEKEKENLKGLDEEVLQLMIDLEKTFADISPSTEGLLYKFTDDDEEDGDIGTEIISLPYFEELF